MPYCSNYSAATWHLALHPRALASGTAPDSAAANRIWLAKYGYIKGRLAAAGITATSGTTAWNVLRDLEAKYTSGQLAIDWSARGSGEVNKHGKFLLEQASAELKLYCDNPSIMSAMSATYCAASFGMAASGSFTDDPDDLNATTEGDINFTRETEF